jgi:hypothetical protein
MEERDRVADLPNRGASGGPAEGGPVGRRFVTISLALVLAAVALIGRADLVADPLRPEPGQLDPPPIQTRIFTPAADALIVPTVLSTDSLPPVEVNAIRLASSPIVPVVNQAPPPDPSPGAPPPVPGAPPPVPGAPPPAPSTTTPPAPNAPPSKPGPANGSTGLEPPIFESPTLPLPAVDMRRLKFANRSSNPTNWKYLNLSTGEQVALITGGIKLVATPDDTGTTVLDIEADQLVIWQTGGKAKEVVDAMSDRDGVVAEDDRQTELYMTGNVVLRYGGGIVPRNPDGSPIEEKTLRASRVYYDMARNRAIAIDYDFESFRPGLMQVPAHTRAKELWQLSAQEWVSENCQAAASKLPADPGLDLLMGKVTIIEQKNQVERTIFGFPVIDRFTGQDVIGSYRTFESRNTFIEFSDVPVFWFPYYAGDVDHPVGPLENFIFRQDNIFGVQLMTTWSVLQLIGVKALPNERFDVMVDYLSMRGPGLGTAYNLSGPKLFGYDAPFITSFLAYGLYDHGYDVLAGERSENWDPSGFRGRARWRYVQDYDDFSFQGQISYLSDINFLEQYYKYEFDMGPNQETFGYFKYQHGNGAATLLTEPNLDRDFISESRWLPRLNGYWLGDSFFDRLTYSTWASAGYTNLNVYELPAWQIPSNVNPATLVTNEKGLNTARFDWMQTLSAPFQAGAFKIVPYVVGDLAAYSVDETGNSVGRAYGAAGARVSLPLTKQYDDVESELLNVNGITHKMQFVANYYNAWSNTPYTSLPQLDRLNDDATQEAVRDITPWQQYFVPGANGNALFNSPLYNPQLYAIRRLVDTNADTLGSIEVLQTEWRQRWQTERGYPGMEHTIDYVTLDLSASYFPAYNRDNFGHPISFLEYNATWAVGDRNGLISSGWMDPFAFGTRYWSMTGYYNRPDGVNYSLSFRWYDPVGSREASAAISYMFSPKYALTFAVAYDFGLSENQSTSLMLTRIGTDLTWTIGFSYNALINNFSFNFMIIPNLLAQQGGGAISPGGIGGAGMMQGRQ